MRTFTSITAAAALGAAFVASLATATPASAAQTTIRVTSEADAGPGTLREALEAGAEHIVIAPSVDVIEIASTLTGHTSVRIEGGGAVIDAHAAGVGLAITAAAGTSGVLRVEISQLTVVGAGDHGLYVTDDQDGNLDAAGSGTPGSVSLTVRNVVVEDVGHGAFDRDGIRVDERDDGSLTFVSIESRFAEAGADGVELDETGPGGVTFDVRTSTFEANGPLNPEDLDDGIDVDEIDTGDVTGSIRSSSFIANHDEGIDINEDGTGSIDVDLVSITVRDTIDGDGIAFEEHGDGSVAAELRSSTSADNTGDGFEIAEDGDGDVTAQVVASMLTGNDKGIDVEELDGGSAGVSVRSTTIADGIGDGLQIAEDGEGILSADLLGSTITGNAKGLDLDEDGPGAGSTLTMRGSTVAGNDQDLDLDDVDQV